MCEVAVCNACALTDHEGHTKMSLESAANERKLRVKAAIESQQRRAETKMTKIVELDENCVKVQEQAARVKSDVQQFVDSIRDFKIRRLRTTDYGWTQGFLAMEDWAEYTTVVRKYEVKIAEYRHRTTNKARSKL